MSSIVKQIEELFCTANEQANILLRCSREVTVRTKQEMDDMDAQIERISTKYAIIQCEILALKRLVDCDPVCETESRMCKNAPGKRAEIKTKN